MAARVTWRDAVIGTVMALLLMLAAIGLVVLALVVWSPSAGACNVPGTEQMPECTTTTVRVITLPAPIDVPAPTSSVPSPPTSSATSVPPSTTAAPATAADVAVAVPALPRFAG